MAPEPVPAPVIEIHPGRLADVGGAQVRRLLPRPRHRTVGAWCFADHFGPAAGSVGGIGPHPHIGLQTVTWLFAGELVHRDSLGSRQAIRPGQLNLMTAGNGVVHAEEADGGAGSDGAAPRHGVQLWVALPEATRLGPAAFEHHGELPRTEIDGAQITVLVGEAGGVRSPARADTDHVGLEVALHGPSVVPVRTEAEHAVIAVDGPILVDGHRLDVGSVAYAAPGRTELALEPVDAGPLRAMVLGGSPFEFEPHMWWNFVGRTRDEVSQAYVDWEEHAARFGPVDTALPRVPAPKPPWGQFHSSSSS